MEDERQKRTSDTSNTGSEGDGSELNRRVDAILGSHSGQPEVTIQEWALLVRSKADRPVPFDELIPSFYRWFEPGLSVDEFLRLVFGADEKGWIDLSYDDEGMKYTMTTPLGCAVLAAVERPMMLAGVFQLTGLEAPYVRSSDALGVEVPEGARIAKEEPKGIGEEG